MIPFLRRYKQALNGKKIKYDKTQYINNNNNFIIDTPGEYAENRNLARTLILYSYEADLIELLMNSTEEYSVYSPNIAAGANREVIGIVTQIDKDNSRADLGEYWLRLAGCKNFFILIHILEREYQKFWIS